MHYPIFRLIDLIDSSLFTLDEFMTRVNPKIITLEKIYLCQTNRISRRGEIFKNNDFHIEL